MKRTEEGFDPNAYRLLVKARFDPNEPSKLGKIPSEPAMRQQREGLGYKQPPPIRISIKRVSNNYITVEDESTNSNKRPSIFDRLRSSTKRISLFERANFDVQIFGNFFPFFGISAEKSSAQLFSSFASALQFFDSQFCSYISSRKLGSGEENLQLSSLVLQLSSSVLQLPLFDLQFWKKLVLETKSKAHYSYGDEPATWSNDGEDEDSEATKTDGED
uniref:Uncharacterized protein n=1 Tax=Solanum tuberosum TaxID=4113 RepID=M0ZZ74_SOLTU